MKEFDFDDVTKPDPGSILTDGIRQWRADCQTGQFKIGSATMRGNKISLEIIGAQITEGEYFGYPHQRWVAVLFIDQDGVLSSILFKTESLDNFEEMYRSSRIKGETLLGRSIIAHMCKRSSRASGTGYYAVEFEVSGNGKFSEAIADFRRIEYSPAMFRQLEYHSDDVVK